MNLFFHLHPGISIRVIILGVCINRQINLHFCSFWIHSHLKHNPQLLSTLHLFNLLTGEFRYHEKQLHQIFSRKISLQIKCSVYLLASIVQSIRPPPWPKRILKHIHLRNSNNLGRHSNSIKRNTDKNTNWPLT